MVSSTVAQYYLVRGRNVLVQIPLPEGVREPGDNTERWRPKQERMGRPAGDSPIKLVKGTPSFVDPTKEGKVAYLSDQPASLQCLVWCGVVNQPVELACGNLVCASCCCKWVEESGQVCK